MNDLKKVVAHFALEGRVAGITAYGEGMINSTWMVRIQNSSTSYILQKINHHIFKDIDMLQNNIQRITHHIKHKLIEQGVTDVSRRVVTLIPALDGKLYNFDGKNYWRMMLMIPDSKTLQAVNARNAYFAGKAFGQFQYMLSDIPEPLGETIPDFHNMEFRLAQLKDAIDNNAANRLSECSDLVKELNERADEMCACERLHREGKLPKRINHCDTKVNNILFDKDDNVLCVIDLDTTMPGFVVSDFGDFMRSAGNKGAEDEKDLTKVGFNMKIFEAYTKGYLEEAKQFLTPLEIDLLPFGAKRITYMQVVRFLTDYLNGDTYYMIKYPEHNLVRTKAQFKLLLDMEAHYDGMKQFIQQQLNK